MASLSRFAFLAFMLGVQAPAGTIEGVVEEYGDARPIAGARITVAPTPSTQARAVLQVTTDASGKFSFKNLPYGEYRVAAEKEGFFNPSMDITQFNAPTSVTTIVALTGAAPMVRSEISLIPAGGVTGRVTDAEGRPLSQVSVGAYNPSYRYDGSLRLTENFHSVRARFVTDDQGRYRIFGLPPGVYYIGVLPVNPGPAARVFYPDAIEPHYALPLKVPPGGEANASIQVPLVRTYKVSGTVVNLVPPTLSGVVQRPGLSLVRQTGEALTDSPPNLTNMASVAEQAAGRFELQNILPGSYDLISAVPSQLRNLFVGRTKIEVRDEDLKDVVVRVQPGADVSIRLVVDGRPSPFTPEAVRAQLRARETWTVPFEVAMIRPGEALSARPRAGEPNPPSPPLLDATGAFVFRYVAEGTYYVETLGLPPDAYVSEVKQWGISDGSGLINVTGTSTQEVQVLINTSGGIVEGDVSDALQRTVADAKVVLVPQGESRSQNTALYKIATTGPQGHFALRGVAPGEYKVFAFDTLMPNAHLNRAFVALHSAQGTSVQVESAKSATNLRLKLLRLR